MRDDLAPGGALGDLALILGCELGGLRCDVDRKVTTLDADTRTGDA